MKPSILLHGFPCLLLAGMMVIECTWKLNVEIRQSCHQPGSLNDNVEQSPLSLPPLTLYTAPPFDFYDFKVLCESESSL